LQPLILAAPILLAGVGRSRSAAAAAAAPHGSCREGDARPPAQHAALRERRAGMPLPAVHAQAAALLGANDIIPKGTYASKIFRSL